MLSLLCAGRRRYRAQRRLGSGDAGKPYQSGRPTQLVCLIVSASTVFATRDFENRVEALVPSAYGIICIADPDTITSILLLTAQARGSLALLALIAAALGARFSHHTFCDRLWAERLMRLLGPGGLHVVTRVLGILLAALAVQFVLNGDKRVRAVARAGRLEPTSIPW